MAMKKTVASAPTSPDGNRRFPPEAYTYNDDVTPEGVEMLRGKAARIIESDEWDIVDGFGRVIYAAS